MTDQQLQHVDAVRNETVHQALALIQTGDRAAALEVLTRGVDYQAFLVGIKVGIKVDVDGDEVAREETQRKGPGVVP